MAETGKSFIKKFVGFSIVTWVSFVLKFLSAPIATRLFDPEVLGKINIFDTYTNLFGTFVLIGLDQAFARFYLDRPNNKTIGYLFTFCFSISYSLLFVFVIVSIPINVFLSRQLFQEEDNLLLYLFFISVFCSCTLRYLNLSYRMEQNIKMYTIQGILITLVSKVFYLGVGFWDSSYKPALIILTLSHFLLALVFLCLQRKKFECISEYDSLFACEMFKYALPLIPVSVLMWANTSIPQVIMQKTMDYHSIGIFTSAAGLASVILIIQAGFNTFWVPYTYENYKTQNGQFDKVHRYLVCVITICALLLVLSQDIVFLMLGEKYREAKFFFPFLVLGPVCYIIGETTGIGINISKKTYYNIIVFSASVIVNIVLCLVFRDVFGVAGIAMATAMAAIISMLIKTYIGDKFYHAVDRYRYMYVCVALITLSSFVTMYSKDMLFKIGMLLFLLAIAFVFFKKELKELKYYASCLMKN